MYQRKVFGRKNEGSLYNSNKSLKFDMPVFHNGAVHFISDCFPYVEKGRPYFRSSNCETMLRIKQCWWWRKSQGRVHMIKVVAWKFYIGKSRRVNSIYLYGEIKEVCVYSMGFNQVWTKFVEKDCENKGESNGNDGKWSYCYRV